MAKKREVLGQLKKGELVEAVERFGLEVADRRVRDQLVEALGASRKAALPAVLEPLPRDRLKELCRALALDDGGRAKADLVARLAGSGPVSAGRAPKAAKPRQANGTPLGSAGSPTIASTASASSPRPATANGARTNGATANDSSSNGASSNGAPSNGAPSNGLRGAQPPGQPKPAATRALTSAAQRRRAPAAGRSRPPHTPKPSASPQRTALPSPRLFAGRMRLHNLPSPEKASDGSRTNSRRHGQDRRAQLETSHRDRRPGGRVTAAALLVRRPHETAQHPLSGDQ